MSKAIITILAALLPLTALAASGSSFAAERSLFLASSTPGNAYAGGATITITGETGGDLSVAAGSLTLGAPVKGDALLAAGSLMLRAAITGDLRAIAGSITIAEPVAGDAVVVGGAISATAPVGRDTLIVGGRVGLLGGAAGPVTVYGNEISLGGSFAGDVRVVAGSHVSLAENTKIAGELSYEAPQEATIPSSAVIKGGVHYTGTSYLPTRQEAHAVALASFGVFLFVKILGALLLAGLLAGLFPRLGEAVAAQTFSASARGVFLTTLLGFGVIVATPVLLILLAITFVGIGLAALLLILYSLLLILAFAFAGILVGALLAHRIWHREELLWRDGVFGMLVLSIVALVPVLGTLLVFVLMAFSMGALLLLFFHFAFPREQATPLL